MADDCYTLRILPKGSRCEDFKPVPSRSDYHKSDEVDRCIRYDTTSRRRKPKPDPKPDSKPPRKKPPADDKPDTKPEPKPEPKPDPKPKPKPKPKKKPKSHLAYTESHHDHPDKKGPDVRYDSKKIDERETIGPWTLKKKSVDIVRWSYEGELDHVKHANVSVEQSTKSPGWYTVGVYGWEEVPLRSSADRDKGKFGIYRWDDLDNPEHMWSDHRSAVASAISWMMDHQDGKIVPPIPEERISGGGDVNGWTQTVDEPLHMQWEGPYEHPFSESDTAVVNAETEEWRDETIWRGTLNTGGDDSRNLSTAQDKAEIVDDLKRWMNDNSPDEVSVVLPGDVNGWVQQPLEENEHYEQVTWERTLAPTYDDPKRAGEEVYLRRSKGKKEWRISANYLDGSGESTGSSIIPTLPKSGGFSRRTSSRREKFNRLNDGIEQAVKYMEEYGPVDYDPDQLPELDVSSSAKPWRRLFDTVKRVGDEKHAMHVSFKTNAIEMRCTDASNVAMLDMSIRRNLLEDPRVWPDGDDEFLVNPEPLAEIVTSVNMSGDIRIRTIKPDTLPTKAIAVYDGSDKLGQVPIVPVEETKVVSLPTLEFTVLAEFDNAEQFVRVLKGANKISWDTYYLVATEEWMDLQVKGDVDRFRGLITDDPNDIEYIHHTEYVATGYSPDYLRDVRMGIPTPKSTPIRIDFGEAYPLRVQWSKDGASMSHFIAPRIKGEDDMDDMIKLRQSGQMHEMDLSNAVLWFHPKANGCRCASQALQFERINRENEAQVYGINTAGIDHNREFVESYNLSYPVIHDEDHLLIKEFGISLDENGNPERTAVFVRDGKEVDRIEGLFPADAVSDVDEREIKEMAQAGRCPLDSARALYERAMIQNDATVSLAQSMEIEDTVEHPFVAVVTGERNSGKSAVAMHVADQKYRADDQQPVIVGMPPEVFEGMPKYWMNVGQIEEAPEGSVVVVDEAYRQFHARDSGKSESTDMSQLVNLAYHCDRSILFVSQESRQIDINAVSQVDAVFAKRPAPLQKEFERRQLRFVTEMAEQSFDNLNGNDPHQAYTYVYTREFKGLVKNEKPEFYTPEIRRTYQGSCLARKTDKVDMSCEPIVDSDYLPV